MKIPISKTEARELVSEKESDNYIVVLDQITGTSRWSIHHELVVKSKATGKYYSATYSTGATEMQDERPFEYDTDTVTFTEVWPNTKTIVEYLPVKEHV